MDAFYQPFQSYLFFACLPFNTPASAVYAHRTGVYNNALVYIRHTVFSHRTPICAWSFVHTKYIETPLFRGGHTLPKAVEVIRKYSFYGFLTKSLWIFYTRNLLSL